jgi:hypothetical protein
VGGNLNVTVSGKVREKTSEGNTRHKEIGKKKNKKQKTKHHFNS